MKNSYVIGIDIGTQGTKAALFSIDGSKAAEAFEASRLICPAPGVVSQDPDELYGSVLRTIKQVMERSQVAPEAVAAIGIDAQMAGIMAVDHDFEAVGAYDSWLDTRCEPYIIEMRRIAEAEIIRKTGGPVTYSHGPKILWRKAEQPEQYRRIVRFVLPGVYAAGKLCGLRGEDAWIDYTHLHFTGFADNQRKCWDQGLLQEFGIDPGKLPRIVSPDTIVGSLTGAAAAACGLTEQTKVAAGCGDSAASALGAGIVEPDLVYDVAGTASIFACSTTAFTPDLNEKTILFARSVLDGLYTPMAYIGGGGMCLKWFRDQHGQDYDYWNQAAEQVEAGSRELYFAPHFSGRTCPGDPGVKGTFWGLSFYHTAGHMYRSILESIAYEYHLYYSILKDLNPQLQPTAIYGAGGGAKAAVFNQIKSDVLGLPYRPLAESDSAVRASAMIAAAGAGLIPDLEAAMKPEFRPQRFVPLPQHQQVYQHSTAVYNRFVKMLSCFGSEETVLNNQSNRQEIER